MEFRHEPSLVALPEAVPTAMATVVYKNDTTKPSPAHTKLSLPRIKIGFITPRKQTDSRKLQKHSSVKEDYRKPTKPLHRYTSLPSPSPGASMEELDGSSSSKIVTDTSCTLSLKNSFQKSQQSSPRSIWSRFEMIEDRFLTVTQTTNASQLQIPRQQLTLQNTLPSPTAAKELSSGKDLIRQRSPERTNVQTFFDICKKFAEPKVRFRKAVRLVILLLRAIYTTRERTRREEKERRLSICVDMSDPLMTSKRAYERYGISFDPQDFKANRQIQITPEARSVLSQDPSQRTYQQLHAVLVSLRQAVPEFSEFPINMQQSLARVGRYERFTAKRVIIRQGHLADNFYFILSGTAVVIILDTDKVTGEQKARTAAVLGRGKSFGELALMHKSRRSATVTCRGDVELLSVGREDFVDIFMHVDRGVEPEHIRFMRKLPLLRDWPLHKLPYDNPKILLFTYVRREVVLCRDSNTSEWIFIIKSGSCRIIKALPALQQQTRSRKPRTPEKTAKDTATVTVNGMQCPPSLPRIQKDLIDAFHEDDEEETSSSLSDEFRPKHISPSDTRLPRLCQEEDDVAPEDGKKLHLQYIDSLDAISDQKQIEDTDSDSQDESHRAASVQHPCYIFVQILKLGPKDIYGLESGVFGGLRKTVSTSLVSDGAEVIMVNRKFFLDNTSAELRKRLRKEIHPLPTEESLQNQLRSRVEWDSFRTDTLMKTMADRKIVDNQRR